MTRSTPLSSAFALVALLGPGQLAGCGMSSEDALTAQRVAALRACKLDDGSVEHSADVRACDPSDVKKTTICHIPPGNPANAHTLCVGNPSVPHHVQNHGDTLGPCVSETPCKLPPPPDGMGGTTGAGGVTGAGGSAAPGGASGSGGDIVP